MRVVFVACFIAGWMACCQTPPAAAVLQSPDDTSGTGASKKTSVSSELVPAVSQSVPDASQAVPPSSGPVASNNTPDPYAFGYKKIPAFAITDPNVVSAASTSGTTIQAPKSGIYHSLPVIGTANGAAGTTINRPSGSNDGSPKTSYTLAEIEAKQ